MQTQVGVKRNLWATRQSGLLAPKRMNFPIDGLELYLPLGHPELSGSPIISKDLNAHSCTVSEAVHNPPTHRYFDGTDDKITLTTPSGLPIGGAARTLMLWVNPTTVDTNYYIFGYGTWADNEYCSLFIHDTAGELKFAAHTNTTESDFNLTAGAWQLVGMTYALDATDVDFYVDGDHKKTGALLSAVKLATASGTDLWVGCRIGSANFLLGSIGEAWLYSRVLSAVEMTHVKNATIWRYR